MKRASLDRKGSRQNPGRPSRRRKRPPPPNRHEIERETASTSASAKKLKTRTVEVPIHAGHGYRLINFLSIFTTLSEMIKCKECGDGNITFSESSVRGLGFKLVVNCDKCEPRYINSCPLINNAYEVNRRIVFAMRLLGVGYDGIKKFCGLMDISKVFNRNIYDSLIENIYCASKAVANLIFSEVVAEEKQLTAVAENVAEPAGLTVTVDGTWRNRGPSSLHKIVTSMGHYTGKVIDVIVKFSNCEECESWKNKMDTKEYDKWKQSHIQNCNAGVYENWQMEMDGVSEMFARSEELHGVKYLSFVDDAEDGKMLEAIVKSHPYGRNVTITNKKCTEDVLKRIRNRNYNLNEFVSSFLPERMFNGTKTVAIASYIAVGIFNKGYSSILQMMDVMNMIIGPNAAAICEELDNTRPPLFGESRTFSASTE